MMKRIFALFFLLCFSARAEAGITCTLPYNLQNNTTADANQVMANYNALVTCFTNAAAAGVNADITALNALSTPLTPSQGGTPVYIGGTSTGSGNAQVVGSATPSGFTLTAGKRITFIAGFTNTAAATLNVNSTGVKNVYVASQSGSQSTSGGEIVAGTVVEAIYDGTQYQLLQTPTLAGGFGPLTNAAAASTVDLGTIGSHNVNITGTTSITSFGSSASTAQPYYRLTFAGATTLTYNATSLITPGVANIVTAANDTATALYLGSGNWQIVGYQRASGAAVVNPTPLCGANGLVVTNNAGTPNTSIDITADSAVLINPTGNVPIYFTSVSVTINLTTTGANALDTGALGNNTFYHHYLISNGSTVAGLSSTSATAPTMPGGYSYLCRVGTSKTNGSALMYGFTQTGNTTQYKVGGANLSAVPAIVTTGIGSSCTSTTPTWSAVTIRGASGAGVWLPTTATDTQLLGYSAGNPGDTLVVAPNSSYAGSNNGTNNQPPMLQPASIAGTTVLWLKMEANTVQACTTVGTRILLGVLGYRDKINAN